MIRPLHYELDPHNPKILVNLALTFKELGRNEEAESALKRALQLEPDLLKK